MEHRHKMDTAPGDKKLLDIVFSIDANYIQHFCVALTSLLEHNRDDVDRVFLMIDEKEVNEKVASTLNFFQTNYHLFIEVLLVDSKQFGVLDMKSYVTLPTYYKILIPEIIPHEVDSVLYLDSDIVVNGDIKGILNCDFRNPDIEEFNPKSGSIDQFYLYAADHLYEYYRKSELERMEKLGLKSSRYFNTGVMWMNLKYCRQMRLTERALQSVHENHSKFLHNDQDLLNLLIDGQFGELDLQYNTFKAAISSVHSPNIIHFISSSKPWHCLNEHPFKKEYQKYLSMTPFRSHKYTDIPFSKCIISRLSKFIHQIYNVIKRKINIWSSGTVLTK